MSVLAVPAAAIPVADVPADATQWETSPYSPLPAAELAAPGNEIALTFDGTEGGLHSAADIDTGFTMVQPSSADPAYYVPGNLEVANGNLTITATKGIAYSKPGSGVSGDINKQDNTLGVGVDATETGVRLTTTLLSPADVHSSAQAGLWFGPDDDNYVKLAVIGNGNATTTKDSRQIQLSREIAGATDTTVPTNDQVTISTTQAALSAAPVTLTLDVNSAAGTMTASYQIGSGAVLPVGTLALPASFADGSLVTEQIPDVSSFAGIFTTKRNMAVASAAAYSFESFAVAEIDTTGPDAPTGLEAAASPSGVTLSWDQAAAESDVVGYRVYRGTESPVATTGAGIAGSAPLTTAEFTDGTTFIGANYHYAVVAVDAAGNPSDAITAETTIPGVDAEVVEKINFQTVETTTPEGFSADTGLPYDADRGFGWISAADGAPLNLSTVTRERTAAGVNPDLRLATIIHMQHVNSTVDGVWEYDLDNGMYTVVAAVGDAGEYATGGYDSVNVINAEGVTLIDGFVPNAAREYDEAVGTVEVTDGTLTIDQTGGDNTKLAYVEIYAEEEAVVAPAAPTDVVATHNASGALIEWTSSEGATSYNVLRAADEAGLADASPLNSEPVTGAEYVDATVEAGNTYYYAVVAVNEGGSSELSESVAVDVPEAPAAPAVPANLDGNITEAGVALTWDATEGATSYDVYRSTDSEVSTEGAPLATVTDAEYVDESAEAGTTYYYAIVAVNEAGASAASEALEIVVPADVPEAPAAPEDFAGTVRADGAVALRWDASEGATGYNLYRGIGAPAEAVGEPLNGATPITETAFVDENVEPDTTYHYIVVAVGDGGSTAAAEQVTVETPTGPQVCAPGQWSVEYFTGTQLIGDPVRTECVDEISEDWGSAGPEGLGTDHFSLRWTTTIDNGAGTYGFQARADDGVRVLVDGVAVIDKWALGSRSVIHTGQLELEDGPHEVVVEYFEDRWAAGVEVDWFKMDEPDEPQVCAPGLWAAEYFGGAKLAGPVLLRECVDEISEDWGNGGPEGVGTDHFSVRWTATLNGGAGTYEFQARADDGVRVLVDGVAVIDKWALGSRSVIHTGQLELEDGPHEVVVEYFEDRWAAGVEVD
ncbi:PA14 domain-containing protein, partial [Georgenia wangjunii]|uniref:PA14 domain-containing protein n=1 Tax=Georgenia wangjunii TaxID=3117730 RepID=UPI002F26184E